MNLKNGVSAKNNIIRVEDSLNSQETFHRCTELWVKQDNPTFFSDLKTGRKTVGYFPNTRRNFFGKDL